MAKEIGAAVAGGSIGLVGDLATTFLNRHWSNIDWERNKQYEQQLYNRNRADYLADLENERKYNSPSAQLDRLREAGLNPNIVSGGTLTTGASSPATMAQPAGMPMMSGSVASFGSFGASANNLASGIAASSNADVNRRKGDAEIVNLKLSAEYKRIENDFLFAEKRLNLKLGEQRFNESVAKCRDYASQISLRDSEITLNGHKIKLVDNQASKAEQESQLAAARQVLTNLDIQKAIAILPYVQAYEEAKIINLNARSDAAKCSAFLSYHQAELFALQAFKEQSLLDAGLVDAEISRINAEIAATRENTKHAKKYARAVGWNAASNMVDAVGKTVLGCAGLYLGYKMPKIPSPSGLMLPNSANFGGEHWKIR